MAVSGEVQIGRINRFFTKWLGAKGSSPRMTIGGELIGVIPLWSGVENRFLDSWGRFAANLLVPAAASNQSGAQFRNPSGSKVVAIVELLSVGSTAVAANQLTTSFGSVAADLVTSVPFTANRLDNRGQGNPVCLGSTQNTTVSIAALGNNMSIDFSGIAAGVLPRVDLIFTDNQEIPVLPGDGIRLVGNTVNTQINLNIRWRERALEDSEQS
jgi:hypothetical protein